MNYLVRTIWGGATGMLHRTRQISWADLLVVLGLAAILSGVFGLSQQWTAKPRPEVFIDLSFSALPGYVLFSLSRGLLAYVLSLCFTLAYGYWAAKDRRAEPLLIPLLDILQSIPVVALMPGLVLAMVALFPASNVGLELAAIVMIFTGQAWNMTFSFYHSLRSIPPDMREAASVYGFNWWQRFKWVELPFAMMGLVWNSMMSMAGGWFFLMLNEAFTLKDKDFRVPGIGSYMSEAVKKHDGSAMAAAVLAMVLMIVLLDQLLWRPVVVWAQKFRVEEGGFQEQMSSWFLDLLRRSSLVAWLKRFFHSSHRSSPIKPAVVPVALEKPVEKKASPLAIILLAVLLVVLCYGAWQLLMMLRLVKPDEWKSIFFTGSLTLGRVLAATALGTVWALPAGIAIGLSPRLSRLLQPVVQVVASFPAPMLFPLVIVVLNRLGITLNWGSILLMLLGTQWYILFNVIAGAMAIPADLKEAARSFGMPARQRFWDVYVPACFPYLVTGWVTAAGGAWNASIVSEYDTFGVGAQAADGLGARISDAAFHGNFPVLAASVVVMSAVVVLFNRLVWRRLYILGEERFSLSK